MYARSDARKKRETNFAFIHSFTLVAPHTHTQTRRRALAHTHTLCLLRIFPELALLPMIGGALSRPFLSVLLSFKIGHVWCVSPSPPPVFIYGDDCKASMTFPQKWQSADGPVYQMYATIPDWRQGSLVTIEFTDNSTTGLGSGGCFNVETDSTQWRDSDRLGLPSYLTFRLGAPSSRDDPNPNRIGCQMRGLPNEHRMIVNYVGSICYVPPPPPPHQFVPCSAEVGLRFAITSRTATGWFGEAYIDKWRVDSVIQMEMAHGEPFSIAAGSEQHVSVLRAGTNWVEFKLDVHTTPLVGTDDRGSFVIPDSGSFSFRAEPAPTNAESSGPMAPRLQCDSGHNRNPPSPPEQYDPPPPPPSPPRPSPPPLRAPPPPSPSPMPSPPPPTPPPPQQLARVGEVARRAPGELAKLMMTISTASDARLREALDMLEQDGAADQTELNAAQDLKRQIIGLQRSLPHGTTVAAFVERHADLISQLEVDLSCCPTANALMEQRVERVREQELHAAASARAAHQDAIRNSVGVAFAALFSMSCLYLFLRRYFCIVDGAPIELPAAHPGNRVRRGVARGMRGGKSTRLRDVEDSDEDEEL